jgi:Fe-S-cluster containining protein
MNKSNTENNTPLTSCIRCGTCCEKGGPAFHLEDRPLIEKGVIHSRNLYTIRQGELARDNIIGHLIPVSTDIIKLKGKRNTWACVFYNKGEKPCEIYEHRPLECRVLKCWNTEEFEDIYSKDYLTRKALLSSKSELWNIIKDHQARCSFDKIINFTNIMEDNKKETVIKEIVDIIKYDISLRQVLVEKGNMDVEILDFLLGRPLVEIIKNYGFKVEATGSKYILTPIK